MNLWIDTAHLGRAQSLFGLSPLERIRRGVAAQIADGIVVVSGPGASEASWSGARLDAGDAPVGARLRAALASAPGPLVVLDGATVIDPRLIRFLGAGVNSLVAMRDDGPRSALAMRLQPSAADAIPADAADLRAVAEALLASGRVERLEESAFPQYIDKLRRFLPWWIYVVETAEERRVLERKMFWDNYKGSTDLLTRYVFPPVVWPLARLCARFHVHPNVVTVLSIVFAFAAVPFFWQGRWLEGFAFAYAMSVLDSVDGKVARLTLTDSWLGNLLDHGLDQVHPPFWYFAWAHGLGGYSSADPLYWWGVWLVILYVGDRLVLRVAKRRLARAIHSLSPVDVHVRSIIARRNILMTIMAGALLIHQGVAALYFVTIWQGLTMAWHASRTVWYGYLMPNEEFRRKKPR